MNHISIIAAVDSNMLIGKDNHLPWSIKEDLHYFRKVTMGHAVVMGKNTWLSIGKALDGRTNIILTHDKSLHAHGCIMVNSIDEVITEYQEQSLFIIGGAITFGEFIPFAEKIYLSRINHVFEGDSFFPKIDWAEWVLISYEKVVTDLSIEISHEIWNRRSVKINLLNL